MRFLLMVGKRLLPLMKSCVCLRQGGLGGVAYGLSFSLRFFAASRAAELDRACQVLEEWPWGCRIAQPLRSEALRLEGPSQGQIAGPGRSLQITVSDGESRVDFLNPRSDKIAQERFGALKRVFPVKTP